MTIPYFEVVAFTDRPFAGNPAGVCLLPDEWLPDEVMQGIAAENNLAETAFLIERDGFLDVRWMTPAIEIDLCGHATLASAHVLFNHLGRPGDSVTFQSKSGPLKVEKKDGLLVLDFPSQPARQCEPPPTLAAGLRATPREVMKQRDYFAVFDRAEEVIAIQPDLEIITKLDAQGVVITAPGSDCDFVSRYFAPAAGIPEDPVTGGAHCMLTPYWARRLRKTELRAFQASRRGGEMICRLVDDRVEMEGACVFYLEGEVEI